MSSAAVGPEKLASMAPPPSDVDLVKLVGALAVPESVDELADAFTGVGRVLSVPMYGFYVLEPGTERIEHNSVSTSATPSLPATRRRWSSTR
jgi:hypothetical protein